MFDGREVTVRQGLDVAHACLAEWTLQPKMGPFIVASVCGIVSSAAGHLLRGTAVPPPQLIAQAIPFLAVIPIGYLLWRLNEWLFERTPFTGRRHIIVGLTLTVAVGVISVWTDQPHQRSLRGFVPPNATFFWAWILWEQRVQSLLRQVPTELG